MVGDPFYLKFWINWPRWSIIAECTLQRGLSATAEHLVKVSGI